MNEHRITRGKDVALYIGEERIYGVADFTAAEERVYREIYEYLSSEPREVHEVGRRYTLRLRLLRLEGDALQREGPFTVTAADGGAVQRYLGCRITEHKSEKDETGKVYDIFTLSTIAREKQVTEHEGNK